MSCSIPVTQETTFSLAPFLLLLALTLSTMRHQALPLLAPTTPCLTTGLPCAKKLSRALRDEQIRSEHIGLENRILSLTLRISTGFGWTCYWAVIQGTFRLAAVPAEAAFTTLLFHRSPATTAHFLPWPLPQSCWYNCVAGKETAPEKRSELSITQPKEVVTFNLDQFPIPLTIWPAISILQHSCRSWVWVGPGCINHGSQRKKLPLAYTITLWSETRAP